MLWYKVWAESRTRFAIAAVVIAGMSVFVIWQNADRAPYGGFSRTLFIVFAIVLAMGGLLRERDLGTAGFTLALPVSRRRLALVRAATGLAQLLVLALVPLVTMVILMRIEGRPFPLGHGLVLALRWFVGGSALFGLGFLASATLGGEYTAFVAALVVFFMETVTLQFIRLAKPPAAAYLFTVQEVMSGLRAGAIPIAVLIVTTTGMIAAAAVWSDRTDF
jgi:ABC-type transport system involved in multi-copper enzyme maturation permease subunit